MIESACGKFDSCYFLETLHAWTTTHAGPRGIAVL
jgi:hypothetical protein